MGIMNPLQVEAPHLLGVMGGEVGEDVLGHAVRVTVGVTDAAGQLGQHNQPHPVGQVLVEALHRRLHVRDSHFLLHNARLKSLGKDLPIAMTAMDSCTPPGASRLRTPGECWMTLWSLWKRPRPANR